MTNKNRYIFNSASPMDTKFDVHRAHGIEDVKFFICHVDYTSRSASLVARPNDERNIPPSIASLNI